MDLVLKWQGLVEGVLRIEEEERFIKVVLGEKEEEEGRVERWLSVILGVQVRGEGLKGGVEVEKLYRTVFLLFHRVGEVMKRGMGEGRKCFSGVLIMDYIQVYYRSNPESVKEFVGTVTEVHPELEQEWVVLKGRIVEYLKWVLKRHSKLSYPTMATHQREKYQHFLWSLFSSTGVTLESVFGSSPQVNRWCNATPDLVVTLLSLYSTVTKFIKTGPTTLPHYLTTKRSFLITLHHCLHLNYLVPLADLKLPLSTRLNLFDQLYIALKRQYDTDTTGSDSNEVTPVRALHNATVIADLTYLHDYVNLVQDILERSDEEFLRARKSRVEFLLNMLIKTQDDLLPTETEVEVDLPPPYLTHNELDRSQEPESGMNSEDTVVLESKTTQVLDIFPDLSSGFVKACLKQLEYNPELLISKILEGDLPPHLDQLDRQMPEERTPPRLPTPEPTPPSLLSQRRNIHDHDEFDLLAPGVKNLPKLGIYKKNTATTEQPLTPANDLKKAVIQLAFNQYEDEYDDSYDQDLVGPVNPDADLPADPSLQHGATLFAAYSAHPASFSRGKDARSSKARKQLRDQTGMTDEQIEGWASMLTREPRRKQALEAQFGIDAIPATPPNPTPLPPPSRPHPHPSTRPPPTTPHDKAYKERHKSRTANHRRKDLHQRKVDR